MLTAIDLLPDVRRVAVARLVAGRGRLLVVGAGGYGKTELLEAAASSLGERGLEIVRVEGRTATTAPLSGLDRLPERLGLDPGADLARTLADALSLRGAALVVDDAHLLDRTSADVLAALWALAPRRRLPVVVARRPGSRTPGLAHLDEAATEPERLWLAPLDAEATAQRAAALLGALPAPAGDPYLAAYVGGSPRLLDRLLDGGPYAAGDAPHAPLVDEVLGALDHLGRPWSLATRALAAAGDDAPLSEALRNLLDGDAALAETLALAGLASGSPAALHPAVVDALASVTPPAVLGPLVDDLLERSELVGATDLRARLHRLAGQDSATAAAAYLAAARLALADRPAEALGWLDLIGGSDDGITEDPEALWLRARAALAVGDVDGAMRAAEAAGTENAQVVVAALLPRLGRWADAAVRYQRHGGDLAPLADLARLRADGAGAATAGAAGDGGLLATALHDTALALRRSLSDPDPIGDAVRDLGTAAALVERLALPLPLPDTPHSLAAILATLAGEASTAADLVDRAIERRTGGAHLDVRHRVLRAWTLLQAGRLASAARQLDALGPARLAPADELARRAVEAGIARRVGTLEHLGQVWRRAEPLVRLATADVAALPVLGELAVAAAKLGHADSTERWLGEAQALVGPPGTPWRAWVSWVAFQAALAAGGDGHDQAAALAIDSRGVAGLQVLGAVAPTWSDCVAGRVDGPAVLAALDRLRDAGFPWEARQLASHAAVRTGGGDLGRTLLDAARRLTGLLEWSAPPTGAPPVVAAAAPAPVVEAASPATTNSGFELTDREEEVVRLLLAGHSYKEVAGLLFISPKTVERHVTNTRSKIGAATRAEFFTALHRYFANR